MTCVFHGENYYPDRVSLSVSSECCCCCSGISWIMCITLVKLTQPVCKHVFLFWPISWRLAAPALALGQRWLFLPWARKPGRASEVFFSNMHSWVDAYLGMRTWVDVWHFSYCSSLIWEMVSLMSYLFFFFKLRKLDLTLYAKTWSSALPVVVGTLGSSHLVWLPKRQSEDKITLCVSVSIAQYTTYSCAMW